MSRFDLPFRTFVGRAAVELFIVMAGVLMALGAQSWWEDRALDADRREARASVAEALRSSDSLLVASTLRVDSLLAAARWLLDPASPIATAADTTLAYYVRMGLWEAQTIEFHVPAYEELKGSGRLGLLPPDVAVGFILVEAEGADLAQSSQDVFQYQIRNLDPWLLDNAPLRRVLRYDDPHDPTVPPASGQGPVMSPEALRSRRVENMLLAKSELLRNLRRNHNELRAAVAEVLRGLEEAGA